MKDNTFEHTFNVIRRQINEEYPELSMHAVTYTDKDKWESALNSNTALSAHPAGEDMLYHLKLSPPELEIDFIGIAHKKKRSFSPFSRKEECLAIFTIDTEFLEKRRAILFPDDPEKWDRILCHSFAWQAVTLYLDYKRRRTDEFIEDANVVKPKNSQTDRLRRNLLSECFASMFMEQAGEKSVIQQLMKRRCELSVVKTPLYKPEDFPFPIAHDATRIVFTDLRNREDTSTRMIKHTMEMCEEIDATCDDITLSQWAEFCYNAQEMAWTGRNKHEILSAATYSSEDAYMRTTAYVIAESLNTDVTPLNKPQFYNPFDDQNKFERLHQKTAISLFEDLLTVAINEQRPEILFQQALQQNKLLFEGQSIGWCAPALIKTCDAYSKEDIRTELLHDVFCQTLSLVKWSDICHLSRFIMLRKRQELPVNPDVIIAEFIKDDDELHLFKEVFSKAI